MSIVVRLAGEPDLVAADRVLRAAFERTASFLPHLRLHCRFAADLFFVAEDAGQIVGTVGAVDYGPVAYVGLMAVEPNRQHQGIARRLVEHLLKELDTRGCKRILLDATEKGAPLYEGFGFIDDGRARVFELRTMTTDSNPQAGLEIFTDANLEELVACDAESFGAPREPLLAALLDLYRDRLLVARDAAGRLQGYLFARDPTLGPWVASSRNVAAALLSEALRLPFLQTPHVMVPRSNDMAAGLLTECGFIEQRSLRHMRRGGTGPGGRPESLFGQSSFAHG